LVHIRTLATLIAPNAIHGTSTDSREPTVADDRSWPGSARANSYANGGNRCRTDIGRVHWKDRSGSKAAVRNLA